MTNEERKLIFDYCGWDYWAWGMKDFNGNDIVEASTIMESKGDLMSFACYLYDSAEISFDDERFKNATFFCNFLQFPYLLQNFFPLFAEWLKESRK